ncbi:CIA30-domain-containing protein [Armillaria solidipes]|uniref:CIA30-domain-containing protein n=1 Tax=Armillaria solidipes TaxID=1076256 RepID=A0A2H3CHB5_9AGAR|nr:CIA30-domain-containing protein [Armillaria solidipes]
MQAVWARYLGRSTEKLKQGIYDAVHMTGADIPSRAPRTLFSFNTRDDIRQFLTGCDADIGGTSTVHFDLDESPKHNAAIGRAATGVFHGDMRLAVKTGMEGQIKGGYAAIQSKRRPTLFGDILEEIEYHSYLALRVRVAGDPSTHNSYFVNVQTDSMVQNDLWQHRLYFKRNDNTWEDIFIPFENFVRTNYGQIAEIKSVMNRRKLRSINISLLGGHSGVSGKYELGIDSIRMVNEEDVKYPLVANQNNEKTSDQGDSNWKDLY